MKYMDYLFENLGDERFQEFCSSLISKEFQNMHTFPVGQPDGGRDSIVYLTTPDSNKKDYIVFQVKYVRNPYEKRDIHKWLTGIISDEIEKIKTLIPKGAKAYYLITNVKGTAHLDSGSIDKVDKILKDNIEIPAYCWWRDDLSRILEKDPIFKWSFTEILNGQDILNSVLFANLQENKERRESVIRAYLGDQFDIDNEVKFKQIDLKNKLLDLFTDVPIRIKKINEKNKSLKRTLCLFDNHNRFFLNEDQYSYDERHLTTGAAEFLLHPIVQSEIEKVLLEGGPGQGKSTISQYICQVHRARLLNKSIDLNSLPEKIKVTPVRLPFKIDLRDIASWLEKKNPYQDILNQEYFDSIWKNSLESFIICHICYHSKLEDFTTSDFIAICKLSPILFVFDGFDEIANIKLRSEVIDFIDKGISRLSVNIKNIQVIITSRPAAFSDSVGFSIDNYPHFELTDITPPIITEYVEKWIKSSNLEIRGANELRKLIKDKLEMPHLKDLAKSPMQLAILISLLRTKGQSLPHKRTALYDSYIDLFFDRESEKNTLIRDKRDLIIDIHQYLAWVLHSEAELYKNNGSISIEDLNSRLKEYLSKDGHDTSIADQLFVVMNERVCALVSRVQGTFEFEVQPLREYFCAKYLYKSAPHSTAGSVKKGTKPERLHAILRNSYWQNVVRFFAGCADAGELDMIIQELNDLQNDELLKYTNYPRIITSQILSDYVFTQKPLKLKDVVKLIINGINIGNIINQDARFFSNEPLILPDECGRKEVINECFQQLVKFPNNDYATELIGILNNNPQNNFEIWSALRLGFNGNHLTKWFEYAYKLRLIYKIDENILKEILSETNDNDKIRRLQLTVNGNRLAVINNDIELKRKTLAEILNCQLSLLRPNMTNNSLYYLSMIFHPHSLFYIFSNSNSNYTFNDHINRVFDHFSNQHEPSTQLSDFSVSDEIDIKIKSFSDSIESLYNTPIANFKSNIEYWDLMVENGRKSFNDNWCFYIAATLAAGIKSKDDIFEDFSDLCNVNLSLCKRVRCARMKSGNVKYWENQFQNNDEILLKLLVFFTWATPKTIIQLLPTLTDIINSIDLEDFVLLTRNLNCTVNISLFNNIHKKQLKELIKTGVVLDEIIYLLSLRFENYDSKELVFKYIKTNKTGVGKINEIKFEYLLSHFLENPTDNEVLDGIKELYKKINKYDERQSFIHRRMEPNIIPYDISKKIMTSCKEYPRILSSLAEKSCKLYANENLRPIGEIAVENNWFDEN